MGHDTSEWKYSDYFVKQDDLTNRAEEYWRKYADNPRECDKVTLGIVTELLGPDTRAAVADVGCFSGNLLHLLRGSLPQAELAGYDIVDAVIERNRRNTGLAGIAFHAADILDFTPDRQFDLVITNAMIGTLQDVAAALRNIAAMLKPGGRYVCFDWFHPYPHELVIGETSAVFPHGVRFYFRSYAAMTALLKDCGLADVEFRPFDIAIDLPRPDPQGPDALVSYTVRGEDGRRLSLKGAIFQPWCHMTARKKA